MFLLAMSSNKKKKEENTKLISVIDFQSNIYKNL